jgi:uncharacterized damage-inducible protein DinB
MFVNFQNAKVCDQARPMPACFALTVGHNVMTGEGAMIMAQMTATEKQRYLDEFEQEFQKTRRVLTAYPKDKLDLRPHPKSKNAMELAWMLVLNQLVVVPAITQSELSPGGLPTVPGTWPELLSTFDTAHKDAVARVNAIGDEALNDTLRMPVGPKQIGDVRRAQALWMFLADTIHHRGQFSIYLRMAGGKVPSIYGPSADEPWV